MKIPVFVSCPSHLSPTQEESRKFITEELDRLCLEESRLDPLIIQQNYHLERF